MKVHTLAVLIITALFSAPLAAQAPSYAIKASVDPVHGKIEADFSIDCPLESGQTALYLRMDLNLREKPNPKMALVVQKKGPSGFDPSYARALDIKVDGKAVSSAFVELENFAFQRYSLDHILLKIELPQSVLGKDRTELSFRYQAKLSDMSSMDDARSADFLASRFSWIPRIASPDSLDAHRLDPFSYRAEIACSAEGWELVPTGTAFEETAPSAWNVSSDVPLASLPLVMLKGFNSYAIPFEEGKKTLKLFYRKGGDFAARGMATHGIDALAYFKDQFYSLDYPVISIVQGMPGTYGMGSDAVVLLGSNFFDGLDSIAPRAWDRLMVYVLSHELGHFYFGVGNPPDFSRQNYLSEGLNELATMRFIEKKYGMWNNIRNEDVKDLGDLFLGSLMPSGFGGSSWRAAKYSKIRDQGRRGYVYPISHGTEDLIVNAMSVTDYDRANIIAEMLESLLGKKAFDSGLASYLRDTRHTDSSTEALKAAMEEAGGSPLDDFFGAYVTGKESLDYALSGKLNAGQDGAYRHQLTVGFKGRGPFVPVTLRLYFKGGKTKDVVVEKAGALSVETETKASYAVLDPDFRSIDFTRLDNVLPFLIKAATPANNALTETGAAVNLTSQMAVVAEGDYGYLGQSLGLGLPGYWMLQALPLLGVKPNDVLGGGLRYAALASLDIPSPSGVSVSLRAFRELGTIDFAQDADPKALTSTVGLSLSWSPAMKADSGYIGRYMVQPLGLSGNFGISSTGSSQASYTQDIAASISLIEFLGLSATLSDSFRLPFDSLAGENRASLELSEYFSPLPRTMVALSASGSWTSGTMARMGNGNSVNGFSSSIEEDRAFGAGAEAFLGVSLMNGKNYNFIRGAALQSLHLGLTYDAATAFSAPGEALANLQQSLGIELIPTIRTILDFQATIGIGAAFNLSRVISAPAEAGSYVPGIYIDLKTASVLGSLFAY